VAAKLGVHPESVRNWLKTQQIDAGERPGISTDERKRIQELEREVRELRRANAILKSASAFFAVELDRRWCLTTSSRPSGQPSLVAVRAERLFGMRG
jgi:transposase-like protein